MIPVACFCNIYFTFISETLYNWIVNQPVIATFRHPGHGHVTFRVFSIMGKVYCKQRRFLLEVPFGDVSDFIERRDAWQVHKDGGRRGW